MSEHILQPQFRYRFRAYIQAHDSDSPIPLQISRQVVSVKLNYAKKTAVIILEQPSIGGAMHSVIFNWCQQPNNPEIWALNGNGEADYVLQLHQAKCIDHDFTFDYAAGGEESIAKHILTLEFDHVALIDPEKRKVRSS